MYSGSTTGAGVNEGGASARRSRSTRCDAPGAAEPPPHTSTLSRAACGAWRKVMSGSAIAGLPVQCAWAGRLASCDSCRGAWSGHAQTRRRETRCDAMRPTPLARGTGGPSKADPAEAHARRRSRRTFRCAESWWLMTAEKAASASKGRSRPSAEGSTSASPSAAPSRASATRRPSGSAKRGASAAGACAAGSARPPDPQGGLGQQGPRPLALHSLD